MGARGLSAEGHRLALPDESGPNSDTPLASRVRRTPPVLAGFPMASVTLLDNLRQCDKCGSGFRLRLTQYDAEHPE